MKSTKRTRWIKFLTLRLSSKPDSEFGALLSLDDILGDAQRRLRNNELLQRRPPANARQHVRVVDVWFDADHAYAAVLFRMIDRDGQDAVYEDFDSGDIEPHHKRPTQGNRVTAHLIINLRGTPSGNDLSFRAALECVSGIPVTTVEQRLCSIGRLCGRRTGSLDGGKTDVEYHAAFSAHPYVERTIRQELQEGVLDNFELVHRVTRQEAHDEQMVVKELRRKLDLDVTAAHPAAVLDDIMRVVQARAQEGGYELIRARYIASGGRHATAEVPNRDDALEALLAKFMKIDLDEDVHPDQTTVSEGIASRMIDLLK